MLFFITIRTFGIMGLKYLNTSHVILYRFSVIGINNGMRYLNTSHVILYRRPEPSPT